MLNLYPSQSRGHSQHSWLDSWHTFSFGGYHNPQRMGWGCLRVINQDMVTPGKGFAPHSHADMEIVSYVLEGALAHKDSLGNGETITPGDVQRMSAGTGITHSEFNPNEGEFAHFLQLWFLPKATGITPSYEQKTFSQAEKTGRLALVISPDGREDSLHIHQDVEMRVALLNGHPPLTYSPKQGNVQWVQVAKGSLSLNGLQLNAGDGVAISNELQLTLSDAQAAEVLLFDMANVRG
jgi:redox-sensitive bicupin YhaK (pirin superfamily)